VLKREIDPVVLSRPNLSKTRAIWGVRPVYDLTASAEFHEYVVAVQATDEGEDRSVLYNITPNGLELCEKDEFEPEAGATIEMGTLAGGKKILQVLKDQVKVYDESKSSRPHLPVAYLHLFTLLSMPRSKPRALTSWYNSALREAKDSLIVIQTQRSIWNAWPPGGRIAYSSYSTIEYLCSTMSTYQLFFSHSIVSLVISI
jgi:hypothetical protein